MLDFLFKFAFNLGEFANFLFDNLGVWGWLFLVFGFALLCWSGKVDSIPELDRLCVGLENKWPSPRNVLTAFRYAFFPGKPEEVVARYLGFSRIILIIFFVVSLMQFGWHRGMVHNFLGWATLLFALLTLYVTIICHRQNPSRYG